MPTPMENALKQLQAQNELQLENQRYVNKITQPYFHKVVRLAEKPSYAKEIYKAVKQTAIDTPYISQKLYNLQAITDKNMSDLLASQSMLLNRKIPAITPENIVSGVIEGLKGETEKPPRSIGNQIDPFHTSKEYLSAILDEDGSRREQWLSKHLLDTYGEEAVKAIRDNSNMSDIEFNGRKIDMKLIRKELADEMKDPNKFIQYKQRKTSRK